jgi:DNA-directed RNA polymerase specialized sigma24 family protein
MKDVTTNSAEREQLFIKLYKAVFPVIARYISKRGGSLEEAKDVFQDAVIIYYEKSVSTQQFPDNEKAYLMGITKHLWLKKYRDNNAYIPLEENSTAMAVPPDHEQQPLSVKLLNYLETSGQKCMELLKSFYYDKLPMNDLAAAFGFSSVRSATVQKFKCLEKVRNIIKSKSLSYEDFVE